MGDEVIINKGYLDDLGLVDMITLPIFLVVLLVYVSIHKNKNISTNNFYRYFPWAVYAKLLGVISFCFVFTYYYKGGDTISYYESCRAFSNLLWERPADFFNVMLGDGNFENYCLFSARTGYPWAYIFMEPRTLFLAKIFSPIVFISFNSYLISSILISMISFVGIWKIYKLLVKYYPQFSKEIAICILFFPTAVFWGSGMLKDTVTLSAFCWFVVGFENAVIRRVHLFKNIIILLVAGYMILAIKPYILMAAIPGLITWMLYAPISKIKNGFLKFLAIPFVLSISIVGGILILYNLGDRLGKFSLNNIIETAVVTQDDLKRDYYKGSSFDIGKIESTPTGILSKAPVAIVAGLFRPFIWEARNVTTLLSGIENLLILLLVIVCLLRLKIFGLFKYLFDHPILLFFFLYSVLFAFSIGISTSNFGALIRFKIAFAPFFIFVFFIVFRLSGSKFKNKIR
ncbi:MAG: hypothetical protein ACK5D5_13540 [Bacteroidota bacterium]|jgi:hypothetical protein